MNQVKIALVGAAGRMGLEITRAATENPNAVIKGAVEYAASPLLGKDIGELAGVGALGVPVTSDLAAAAASCDVIVDLSLPKATAAVIDTAVATGTALVCGTTGVAPETVAKFDEAAHTIPVIYTKNFSLGIAVLSALAARAAQVLGTDYDIEIVEKHHRKKVDAPSGTAQILADTICDATPDTGRDTVYGREGTTGLRPEGQIGIHAVRGGGIFGDHTVIFAGEHERLEISHMAETRSLFTLGAVTAAIFTAKQEPGRYTMKDVYGL